MNGKPKPTAANHGGPMRVGVSDVKLSARSPGSGAGEQGLASHLSQAGRAGLVAALAAKILHDAARKRGGGALTRRDATVVAERIAEHLFAERRRGRS